MSQRTNWGLYNTIMSVQQTIKLKIQHEYYFKTAKEMTETFLRDFADQMRNALSSSITVDITERRKAGIAVSYGITADSLNHEIRNQLMAIPTNGMIPRWPPS